MRKKIRYYRIIWLEYDLPAGISVFLVALPLCLGIALASGAPLYSGIMTGIIGGLLVSLISGSQLAVSGPAAGLTTVVAASIISLGDYRVFLLAVIVAGLFQVLLGLFKLGAIANYFPSSVIKGMLAAIGIILIAKQIPLALGYDEPDFWAGGFLKLFNSKHFSGSLISLGHQFSTGAIIITVISIGIMAFMQQSASPKMKIIPAPLIVVLIGIFGNIIFSHFMPTLMLKPGQLVNIPPNIFEAILFPDFSKIFSNSEIWKDGITIGLLATLETLLCIEAIDKLDKRNRITPVNRELLAQGIGNMACGFLGAIPMTAVVVRGAANVDAGARTKMSAFTHGLFLLLAVVFIPFILNLIPYASLAAILIITGYNLTTPKLFHAMWKLGIKQFLPFSITIVAILLTDLLIGVTTGLLFAIYFIIRNNFKEEYEITDSKVNGKSSYIIKLNSNVTFLNKANLKKALDQIPEDSSLVIDGSDCNFIDYDIVEIISEFSNKANNKGIDLHLISVPTVNVKAVH